MRAALQRSAPVLVVLAALIALLYPLALAFGLPLARRTMSDLRQWERETVASRPLALLDGARSAADPAVVLPPCAEGAAGSPGEAAAPSAGAAAGGGCTVTLAFPALPERPLLLGGAAPLPALPQAAGEGMLTAELPAAQPLARLGPALERLGPQLYRLGAPLDGADRSPAPLYLGVVLAQEGVRPAREVPDGTRTTFRFEDAGGPVLLDRALLVEGVDYRTSGAAVTFTEPPPFGSDLRRVAADYGVVDEESGTVAFAVPPSAEVRLADDVIRVAERLAGEIDGSNRGFRLGHGRIVENDDDRALYLDGRLLSDEGHRAGERADGVRRDFRFDGAEGIVTVDGVVQSDGADYVRDGSLVTLRSPPPRNAQVRQHPDYYLQDPAEGRVLLAEAPAPGSVLWAERYSVYSRPGCGQTLMECFYALPQHPVPFPHWIAERVPAFVQKYPLGDERNVLRATLYTAVGTLSALLLGAAVGIVLAVLFVLLRPLERALLPWVIASQTVPIIALVPVLLLVLGNFGITIQTSLLPTAIIGAYIAFFAIAVGTVKGLRSVDPLALDLMRSYAADPFQVFLKVRFPAAVPFLFTSLKLGAAAALVGALVAETESNNRRGLGFQILGQVQSGNVADVWILLIVSALLGVGLVGLVGLLERLLAPWERAS